MPRNSEEMDLLLLEGVKDLISKLSNDEYDEGQLKSRLPLIFNNWLYVNDYYIPDDALITRIDDYKEWCKTKTGEDAGQLMEEIAYLAFRCLKGWERILSYRSFSAQHDLEISGSTSDWSLIIKFLHLPESGRSIIVEAKNLDGPVNDQQFSRLCAIVQNKFESTSHLGVFFTRLGATGFPTPSRHAQSLRDARATQILFHARSKKFIVVLTDSDIKLLKKKGALLKILESKIQDVESATKSGLNLDFKEELAEVELPAHLKKHG